MKKLIAAALLSLAVVSAFAMGGPEAMHNRFGDAEKVSVSGTVSFSGVSGHVVLTSGEKEYELRYPRRFEAEIGIKEGDTLAVEGYLLPDTCGYDADDQNGDTLLYVTKAIYKGKEYTQESFGYGRGRRFDDRHRSRGMYDRDTPRGGGR